MFHYFISPVSPTVNLRELFCGVYSYQMLESNPCGILKKYCYTSSLCIAFL